MIDGKTSCDNPVYPHRDIYPKLFDLAIEKGTCFIAIFSVTKLPRIPSTLCLHPTGKD